MRKVKIEVTIDDVAGAAIKIQRKQAHNNPIEKARQELYKQQFTTNYGGIYAEENK